MVFGVWGGVVLGVGLLLLLGIGGELTGVALVSGLGSLLGLDGAAGVFSEEDVEFGFAVLEFAVEVVFEVALGHAGYPRALELPSDVTFWDVAGCVVEIWFEDVAALVPYALLHSLGCGRH